jgi:ABC-type polysaccharide/polyol phosphate export permease
VVTAVNELWSYRFLIWNLAQRDLRSRYKKSILGWLWSLINPATNLIILSIVFGVFFGSPAPTAGNGTTAVFALWLFCGLVVWNFFSGTVNGSIGALQASGGMLNKVYFPPVAPAIANMITIMLQTIIEFGILAVVMVLVHNADWHILLVPFLILFLAIFSLGVGLLVSIFNVFYRDVGYIVAIGLNVLFYATPIIYNYQLQVEPQLAKYGMQWAGYLFQYNPLTQFVGASRDLFYYQTMPGVGSIAYMVVVSLSMFVVGWWFFNRKARMATEEL